MIAIFQTLHLLDSNWLLIPLSSHQKVCTTLKTGLSGLESATSGLLAEWLRWHWSRVLEGDKRLNVNVEKWAHSRHLLLHCLNIFSVHAYT